MDARTDFELAYWRQASREESDRRQRAILAMWGFGGARSVLEIGTGPWGGCLPFVEAERKVGIDPLYADYAEAGLLPTFGGYGRIRATAEELPHLGFKPFDAILTMNALDHGDCDFRAIDNIAALLKPGGRFYLHVHLRTPDQLNVGHDHALRAEDLDAAMKRAGLIEQSFRIWDYDPIEPRSYKTAIGIWRKPPCSIS